MSNENPDRLAELAELAEPIKASLLRKLQEILTGRRSEFKYQEAQWATFLEQAQDQERFVVTVTLFPPLHKGPALIVFTKTKGEDGVMLNLAPLKEEVFGEMTPADFRTLCEFGAQDSYNCWADILRTSSSEHLDSDYNGCYTYREFYELRLSHAQVCLDFIASQGPQVDLREEFEIH